MVVKSCREKMFTMKLEKIKKIARILIFQTTRMHV